MQGSMWTIHTDTYVTYRYIRYILIQTHTMIHTDMHLGSARFHVNNTYRYKQIQTGTYNMHSPQNTYMIHTDTYQYIQYCMQRTLKSSACICMYFVCILYVFCMYFVCIVCICAYRTPNTFGCKKYMQIHTICTRYAQRYIQIHTIHAFFVCIYVSVCICMYL